MSAQLTQYRGTVTIADLTDRQARFVQAYVECGTQRDGAIQAALAAGYGNGDRKQAKSRAYELLHDPRILAVLRDEISKNFSAAAVVGTGVLIELAQNAKSETVRLGAARELVDRGYGPIMSRNTPAPDTKQQEIDAFYERLSESLKVVGTGTADDEDDAEALDKYEMSRRPAAPDAETEECRDRGMIVD